MDCSPPGSSVHGILQTRILEWVAISFSRGSSSPRNQTCISALASGLFTKPPRKPIRNNIRVQFLLVLLVFWVRRSLSSVNSLIILLAHFPIELLFFFYEFACWKTILQEFHIPVWSGSSEKKAYLGVFFFNWSLVDLQCYVSFRCTAKWFIYILFFFIFFHMVYYKILNIVAVLYSRTLWFICFMYGTLYLLIPNSQFIPPPPLSPLVTVSLFTMFVSLFLFCI